MNNLQSINQSNSLDILDLTTAELAGLLGSAQKMLLLKAEEDVSQTTLSEQALKDARERLIERGLFNKDGIIEEKYQTSLAPLFSADTALFLVKDLPGQIRKSVTYLRKEDVILFYGKYGEDHYRVEVIRTINQITDFISDWFQVNQYGNEKECFGVDAVSLEKARDLAQKGKLSEAWNEIKNGGDYNQIDVEELLDTIHTPYLSGSFALLEHKGEGSFDEFSMAMIANDHTIWHIYQPDPEMKTWLVDGNVNNMSRMLDRSVQRFLGGEMFDEPIDPQNVITFSLTADELAYCLAAVNAPAQSNELIRNAHPQETEQELTERIATAGFALLARGWCLSSQSGFPRLSKKLESAVFPLIKFDYYVQAEITRPQLHSFATVNILKGRTFTSILRPDEKTYVLEHGDVTAAAKYVSKLFLDFGESSNDDGMKVIKINYDFISAALNESAEKRIADLKSAGLPEPAARLLGQDFDNALYRGSIIRVESGSQADEQAIRQAKKSTLLLLKSSKRSWIFEFPPEDDTNGELSIVDRPGFEKILTLFLR